MPNNNDKKHPALVKMAELGGMAIVVITSNVATQPAAQVDEIKAQIAELSTTVKIELRDHETRIASLERAP